MSKNYKVTAKKIAELNFNIVAENEEEALIIIEDLVNNSDLFSVAKNQLIDLTVEENVNQIEEENNSHSEHSKIDNCENCEYYCPICNSCMIDE